MAITENSKYVTIKMDDFEDMDNFFKILDILKVPKLEQRLVTEIKFIVHAWELVAEPDPDKEEQKY